MGEFTQSRRRTGRKSDARRRPARHVLSAALAKNFTVEAAKGVNNDLHGSAAYRAHLVAVMAARAVEAAG